MANPPFNISEWWDGKLEGDPRWVYGIPPKPAQRDRAIPMPEGTSQVASEARDDGEPFEEKMTRLVVELDAQFIESAAWSPRSGRA